MTNYNSSVLPSTPEIYQHPWYTAQQQLESITTSESKSKLKPKPETIGPKSTNPNVIGDFWEHHVIVETMRRGAEVFKNVGCTGDIDMVLRIDGQFIPIDVKLDTWNKRTGVWASHSVCAPDVYHVRVRPEDGSITWQLKRGCRSGYKCPEGLENFWDQPIH